MRKGLFHRWIGLWALASVPLAAQTPILPAGTYEFVAGNSGLALAATGTSGGSAAVQQTYAAADNQQWTVTNLSGNTIELTLAGTSEALESPASSTVDGAHLDVSTYTGATGQQWNVVSVSSGVIELVNALSGYAVNVSGNSTSSGATLCQWNANASQNERWTYAPVSGGEAPPEPTLYTLTVTNGSGSGSYAAGASVTVTANAAASGTVFAGWTGSTGALASASLATTTLTMPASTASITATYTTVPTPPAGGGGSGSTLANGTYEVVSLSSGLALAGAAATDGSAAVQQVYSAASTQQWTVTNLGDDVIELTLAGTDEALETPDGNLTAGANLDVSAYEDDDSQQWEVETSSAGDIELVNVASGYAINVAGNSTSAGTKMCQWNANESSNELWTFTAVASSGGSGSGTGSGTGSGSGSGSGSTGTSAVSPFGVACDAAQTTKGASWMPVMATAGVANARLSAPWNEIEATQGTFNYSEMDTIMANAASNHLTVDALLGFNPSWVKTNGGAFPTGSLSDWSTYVGNMVSRYSQITQWEVWNEPDTATNATPADYATTVVAAYNAAKAANPQAQVGITVSEVNVNWLREAIVAGAADHFDYIAVHPYTVLYNMSQGWEGDYLGIVKTIRAMLAATDPGRANVPIVFTEIGDKVGYGYITPTIQAGDLVKAFTMGVAEGVTYIDWFEAEDGDSGAFGLLTSTGTPRPAYNAMESTITALGAVPSYQGWLLLNNQDYAFVFNNGTTTVLAAWAPPGVTDSVTFSHAVQVINPLTGVSTGLAAGATLSLTNTPVLVVGVPADLLATAQANKTAPFPWKGNYTGATTVSIQMGNPNVESGLHQMNTSSFSPAQVQGSWVQDVSAQSGQNYEVDPNVLTYTPRKIQVTVVVMAKNSSAGFNFKYESASGFKGIGWNGIPNDGQWHTFTFSPTDDEFVGIWGYNFQLNSDSTTHSDYYLKSVTFQLLQ